MNLNKSIICLIFVFLNSAHAANYYVDYGAGNDLYTGNGPYNAWKHCPGDPAATGVPAATNLSGGDIIYFRGGIVYEGEIRINRNGSPGNPITFKGDGWGTEKAIIDGADHFENIWTRCQSEYECSGNPNFQSIYYTNAPLNFDYFAGFYEDNNFLWFSQDPNPSDPFYHDRISEFYVVPMGANMTRTQLVDSAYFTQADSNYWDGAYIIAWRIPNVTSTKPITAYNPASRTITFEDLDGDVYTDRNSYYALLNHVGLIDRPGEYSYDVKLNRIYLWPLQSDPPTDHTYSIKKRQMGIVYSGRSNIVIEGFIVQNFVLGIRSDNSNTENVVIRNNEVRNLRSDNWYAVQINGNNITVQNNRVVDCNRSVGILAAGENILVKDNYIKRTSRQGIWFMGVTYGQIINNTVEDINGTHSNGISVYLYNKDILVAGNRIINCGSAFTFEGGNSPPDHRINLVLYNNYFDTDSHGWGYDARDITLVNNYFGEGFFFDDTDTLTVAINNIFHAGGDADFRRNNIYTALGWWQRDSYGWSLQEGEIDWSTRNINEIFYISNHTMSLADSSPAIDAGIDPTPYLPITLFPDYNFDVDVNGNPRVARGQWDIGPVEYSNAIGLARQYVLYQNYPNPFNPSTTISFYLNSTSIVSLKIYDLLGREVATIISESLPAGDHSEQWNAIGLSSGIYFYRLSSESYTICKKMLVIK